MDAMGERTPVIVVVVAIVVVGGLVFGTFAVAVVVVGGLVFGTFVTVVHPSSSSCLACGNHSSNMNVQC